MVRPIQRAGSRNSGISSSDSSVTCQEILSMTTSVSVSVTMLVMTPEKVSEKARCAPITSLPSLLTRAPVRVRVKNATGIRCTWSNTAVRRSRIRPSPMVDDSHRVTSDTPASATATAAITAASITTTPAAAVADLVDHLARQQRSGQAEQRADHADHDEHAQPAVMPRGEAPDPTEQLTVGQRPQVAALGVRLPVQGLPALPFRNSLIHRKTSTMDEVNDFPGCCGLEPRGSVARGQPGSPRPKRDRCPTASPHRHACRGPTAHTALRASRPSTTR